MFVCICHGPHAEVKGPLVGVACILRIKLRSASLVNTFTHGATSLVLEIGFINAEAKPFFYISGLQAKGFGKHGKQHALGPLLHNDMS